MPKLNRIYCMDCLWGLKDFSDESIDLILTDPPYGINKEGVTNDDSLKVYYESLPQLYRVLKAGSFFVLFVSIGNLPEFFKNNPFTYRWQMIQYINNGMVRGAVGFNRYLSILIFQKGSAKVNGQALDIKEYSTSSKACKLRRHPTEKMLAMCKYLVSKFSRVGDVVLDPFAGSGTSLVSAKKLKRQYVGFEIEQSYTDTANDRLNEIVTIDQSFDNDKLW